MKHVSAKFVRLLLSEDQKNNRLNVCYSSREQVGNDPQILSKVVTGDETCCYGFADVSEVNKKTLEVLNNISTEEFQKCFQQWEKRWQKCIGEKESTLKETRFVIVQNLINHKKKIIPVIFGSSLVSTTKVGMTVLGFYLQ